MPLGWRRWLCCFCLWGNGCGKGKPSDVTVHPPCGRTPFTAPMVNPLTASSPCGRAHLVTDSPNPVDGNTFPLRADAPVHPAIQPLAHGYIPHVGGRPPGLGAGCRQEKRLPHAGAPSARMRHRPAADGFPVRAHGNARNAGRAKPCGTSLIPGAQRVGAVRLTWLGKPKRSCRRASRLQ